MRYAVHRKDNADPLVVEALERAGWLVGKWGHGGAPDCVCYHPGRKVFRLVEIKTPKTQYGKSLRASQDRFRAKGWPVAVIRTPEEAVRL